MKDENGHYDYCPRWQRIRLNADRDMMRKIIGIQPCYCEERTNLEARLKALEKFETGSRKTRIRIK